MENKKIVVALGRNAFGETFPEQKANVSKAAKAIADLTEAKYQIVITHSNGPQVGMIQTAMTEFARLDSRYTVAPMSLCGAMSQGYIGYDLQNAIRTELLNRGIYKTVSTVITQVKVDPFDRAFSNPTKVIGRYMTKEEAEAEEAKGNYVVKEDQGYRRIIAAPKPQDIYEIDAVRVLLDAGQIVIAAGGGGIPVLEQKTVLKGASAIIEKDYAAARLAELVDAGTLLFLTAADRLVIHAGTDREQAFDRIAAADLKAYVNEENMGAVTTLPKVDAAVKFVLAGSGRRAVIAGLDSAKDALAGRSGTTIM